MNHKTFKVIFFVIFFMALAGIILQYTAIGYGITHPEAVGKFFGEIMNGFNSVK